MITTMHLSVPSRLVLALVLPSLGCTSTRDMGLGGDGAATDPAPASTGERDEGDASTGGLSSRGDPASTGLASTGLVGTGQTSEGETGREGTSEATDPGSSGCVDDPTCNTDTFDCGESQCQSSAEYCYEFQSGVPAPSSYACMALPDACIADRSCACLETEGAAGGAILCSAGAAGELTVVVAAP